MAACTVTFRVVVAPWLRRYLQHLETYLRDTGAELDVPALHSVFNRGITVIHEPGPRTAQPPQRP